MCIRDRYQRRVHGGETHTWQPRMRSNSKTSTPSHVQIVQPVASQRKTGLNNKDGKPKDTKENILKKIQFCSRPSENMTEEEKCIKLNYVHELTDLVKDQNPTTNILLQHLDSSIEMIEKNIFRPLPDLKRSTKTSEAGGMDEDGTLSDPAWPLLQPIYEFFFNLVTNEACDLKSLKVFITHTFIEMLLELFNSEDILEREALKNILHRLYSKLIPRRKMIRKAMNDCFYTLIHENYKFNGASELLDILASIISGFAVPLREEHNQFFRTVIIPLHKIQTSQAYHDQLLRCSMLFLSKDPSLSIPLVEGLLRYWPFANYHKEMTFLAELLEVLEVCDISKLEPVASKLFKRITKCIAGAHVQVSDRAMCYFENQYFMSILKIHRNVAFPVLVPVIAALAETHWHTVIQDSLRALRQILKETDLHAYETALQSKDLKILSLVQDVKKRKQERAKVDRKWELLTQLAKSKNPQFETPIIPYSENHAVGQFNGLNNGNIFTEQDSICREAIRWRPQIRVHLIYHCMKELYFVYLFRTDLITFTLLYFHSCDESPFQK
eukprot:TRINITY_DN4773_c0_g1_i2.p1 TRINITY_DN4773_c0_g1~~TRINITY_DN4773_c0_g1_i2.p1  ORF type:complete len:554 (-),score=47.26 TRINITY_DN4773_c0_g1_i2:174-1835(-)